MVSACWRASIRTQARRLRGDGAASGADLIDDVNILLADACGEGDPFEQVLEAASLEDDADDVGLVSLVGVDQLLRKHVLGVGLERLQLGQPRASSDQFAAQLRAAERAWRSAPLGCARSGARGSQCFGSAAPGGSRPTSQRPKGLRSWLWPELICCWSWPVLAARATGAREDAASTPRAPQQRRQHGADGTIGWPSEAEHHVAETATRQPRAPRFPCTDTDPRRRSR